MPPKKRVSTPKKNGPEPVAASTPIASRSRNERSGDRQQYRPVVERKRTTNHGNPDRRERGGHTAPSPRKERKSVSVREFIDDIAVREGSSSKGKGRAHTDGNASAKRLKLTGGSTPKEDDPSDDEGDLFGDEQGDELAEDSFIDDGCLDESAAEGEDGPDGELSGPDTDTEPDPETVANIQRGEDILHSNNVIEHGRQFDVRSKWFLLTYPACDIDLLPIYDRLKGIAAVDKLFIVKEFHSNHPLWTTHPEFADRLRITQTSAPGTSTHVHVLLGNNLMERRGMRLRTCRTFDVGTFHCNVRPVTCGTEGNVLDYVAKYLKMFTEAELEILKRHGFDYMTYNMDWPDCLMLMGRRHPGQTVVSDELQSFLDMLDSGMTVSDIVTEESSLKPFVFKNSTKIAAYLKLVQQKRKRPEHIRAWDALEAQADDAEGMILVAWLAKNVQTERALRQKQLWICGRPGVGKSTLKEWLMKRTWVYLPPPEAYDTDFHNDYDLIILDEFTGKGKSLEWIKEVADGSTYPMKRKFQAPLLKTKNMPLIVLSNYLPEECPHWHLDEVTHKAVTDRFITLEFSTFLPSCFML